MTPFRSFVGLKKKSPLPPLSDLELLGRTERNRTRIYETIRQEFRQNSTMEKSSAPYQKKLDEAFRALKEMKKYDGMNKKTHVEYNQYDGSKGGFSPTSLSS
jgi:hypothetical protein